MRDGVLSGIRILDLTHVWAGPLAVRVLADLGADVVKVEAPTLRGPRDVGGATPLGGWIGGEAGAEPWNANAIFVKLARNRRSLCIDLKSPAGHEKFLELVGVADIVIENFSARAMPSLGLDYAALRAANDQIIYVTMPGYGIHGPYRDWVAFGPTVEAMSGLTQVMGYGPDEPRNTAMALMDPITAMSATTAVVTALNERRQTGTGALVEMSLHEGGVNYSGPWLIDAQHRTKSGAPSQTPMGNAHPAMAPHGVYRCSGRDEWLALACRDDEDWQRLAQLLGADATLDLSARRAQATALDATIATWCTERNKHAATAELQAAGIPAGPVNTTPDMTADPQVQAREFFVPLEQNVPVPGNPVQMPGMDSSQWTPCPKLGEHNAEVLAEWLGMDAADIDVLIADRVLADSPPG